MKENFRQVRKESWRGRRSILSIAFLLVLLSTVTWGSLKAQETRMGRITGKLVNSENGEPVIGATVMIQGTTIGAATDLDGNFVISKVPAGSYTIRVSAVGFVMTRIDSLTVLGKDVKRIDLALKPEVIESGTEVVVEAKRLRDNDASLLRQRQMANAVSDAIGAETISRSGAGDAAEAMTKMTGSSVVGGRYVLIRGLGDRYVNTQLNGSLLPSADPDKPAVQMDLIPASMLDNITVQKTFTPDKPGDFSGGSVNMTTKDVPEKPFLQLTMSSAYNSEVTHKDGVLTQPGGDEKVLGLGIGRDDGLLDLPEIVPDRIPSYGEVFRDSTKAYSLDAVAKAFNNDYSFEKRSVPPNGSYSLFIGLPLGTISTPLETIRLGILSSATTSNRNYSFYDDGVQARWEHLGPGSTTLRNLHYFKDTKAADEISWGSVSRLSVGLGRHSDLSVNYNYIGSGEKTSRVLDGTVPPWLDGGFVNTRVMHYTERKMTALQFAGEHTLSRRYPLRIEWRASDSENTQNEPDLRYFTYDYTILDNGDTSYSISQNLYPLPAHYFRDLKEKNREYSLDISIPLAGQENVRRNKLKFGGAYLEKSREQWERIFFITNPAPDIVRFDGDIDAFMADSSTGIVGSRFIPGTGTRYLFGNHPLELSDPASNYDGRQKIVSWYGMAELPLLTHLDLVGGVRAEKTAMEVKAENGKSGTIDVTDWLPSVNLIYHLMRDMNLRWSYSRTLARPTLREMSPFANWEFINDYILNGNPNLQRTTIQNYDLRWEWFTKPGEVLAVSGFYKRLRNPIEKVNLTINGQVQYQNVSRAEFYGVEFEVRKELNEIPLPWWGQIQVPWLNHFQLGGNITLVHSWVKLDEFELLLTRDTNPDAPDYRPFQGQSPYMVNLNFGYENPKSGSAVNLLYNAFGSRMVITSMGADPDVYELPRNMIDFVGSQRIWRGLKLKCAAKNILGEKYHTVQTYFGKEYVASEHSIGRTFSLGFSYEL